MTTPDLRAFRQGSAARPTGLEPATTYYWRIRACKPFLSRWSDTWPFNRILGGSNIVPLLSAPAAGVKTAIKPVFQWSTIAAADKYDLLVVKDNAFRDVVIDRTGDMALSSNVWKSKINLENDTKYYSKVNPARTKAVECGARSARLRRNLYLSPQYLSHLTPTNRWTHRHKHIQ